MSARRQLLILLMLTVAIRGLMFISYPMGGQDEGQGYQRYAVGKILAGDLQIGNLRYAPGYTLFIAPISAIGDLFGRFDDRVELLFQIILSATIPFLLYDILRTRHSPRAAFLVALLSLIEPFSLQWAHYFTPVWFVALCFVFALWLLHHAERRRSGRLVAAAGLIAGCGMLGRWNFAPVVLGMACLLLCFRQEALRRRIRHFLLFGLSALFIALLVHVTVQIPATGVWHINCVSAINMLETVQMANMTVHEDHGPHSKRFLRWTSLAPLPQHETASGNYPIWFSEVYPLWQTPGTWASEAERAAFIQQSAANAPSSIQGPNAHGLSNWLFFYLGPCELDRLLRGVFLESVFAQPLLWLQGIPKNARQLLQPPITMKGIRDNNIPHADALEFEAAGGILGFQKAYGRFHHFTGQWLWRPGIELVSALWGPLNALRFLVFPALVWAIFTRHRVYTLMAGLLLSYVLAIAALDSPPELRVYAIVYPLGPALMGGMLSALLATLRERWRGRAAL